MTKSRRLLRDPQELSIFISRYALFARCVGSNRRFQFQTSSQLIIGGQTIGLLSSHCGQQAELAEFQNKQKWFVSDITLRCGMTRLNVRHTRESDRNPRAHRRVQRTVTW